LSKLLGFAFTVAGAGALAGAIKVSMRFALSPKAQRWRPRLLAIALGVASSVLMPLGLVFLAQPHPPDYLVAGCLGAWALAMSIFGISVFSLGAARHDRQASSEPN
jgi:hypothetical protein